MERQPEKPILKAKARDVRTIATLLRALAQTVTCQVIVSAAGLQVTTDLYQNLQAIAYIGAPLFEVYEYTPPIGDLTADEEDDVATSVFEVSLSTWLACLNIYGTAGPAITSAGGASASTHGTDRAIGRAPFGSVGTGDGGNQSTFGRAMSRTAVEMSYAAHGEPLEIKLEEGKVTTRCKLKTSEDTMLTTDMPFINEQTESQVIMRSKDLTEALLSIDQSSKHVQFSFTDAKRPRRRRHASPENLPQTPKRGHASALDMSIDRNGTSSERGVAMMRITASGDAGSTELEFPNKNKVFESFACSIEGSYSYDYKTLQHCLRALQASSKSSIRIDQNGMMSLQCMFPSRPVPVEVGERYNANANNIGEAAAASADAYGHERHGFVEIKLLALSDEAAYGLS